MAYYSSTVFSVPPIDEFSSISRSHFAVAEMCHVHSHHIFHSQYETFQIRYVEHSRYASIHHRYFDGLPHYGRLSARKPSQLVSLPCMRTVCLFKVHQISSIFMSFSHKIVGLTFHKHTITRRTCHPPGESFMGHFRSLVLIPQYYR